MWKIIKKFLLKTNTTQLFLSFSDFYHEYQHIFRESPSYFCTFLKSDSALLSEVITDRSRAKLYKIQIKMCLEFLESFLKDNLKHLTEEHY